MLIDLKLELFDKKFDFISRLDAKFIFLLDYYLESDWVFILLASMLVAKLENSLVFCIYLILPNLRFLKFPRRLDELLESFKF